MSDFNLNQFVVFFKGGVKKKIFKKSLEFSRQGGGGTAKSKKIPDFFFNFSICVLIHPEMQRNFFFFRGGVPSQALHSLVSYFFGRLP